MTKPISLEGGPGATSALRIDAVLVDDVPFGVDTPEQLEEARAIFARRSR